MWLVVLVVFLGVMTYANLMLTSTGEVPAMTSEVRFYHEGGSVPRVTCHQLLKCKINSLSCVSR